MTCHECREMLTPWVDGELSGRDAGVVERHLAGCASCRHEAGRVRGFQERLRESFARPSAPADLRARLLALARGESPAARRPPLARRPLVYALASAAALVAVLGVWGMRDRMRDQKEWCRTFVDDHQEGLLTGPRLENSTRSPEELSRWFGETMRQRVTVPALAGATLLGGRRCVLKGHTVGLAVYQHARSQLSLFLTDDPAVTPPDWRLAAGEVHVVREGGYTLAAWRSSGMLRVLVGELPPAALKRLIAKTSAPPA